MSLKALGMDGETLSSHVHATLPPVVGESSLWDQYSYRWSCVFSTVQKPPVITLHQHQVLMSAWDQKIVQYPHIQYTWQQVNHIPDEKVLSLKKICVFFLQVPDFSEGVSSVIFHYNKKSQDGNLGTSIRYRTIRIANKHIISRLLLSFCYSCHSHQ